MDTLNMQLLADCRGAEGRNMHLEEPTGCRALVCVEHDGLPQPGLYKSKSSRWAGSHLSNASLKLLWNNWSSVKGHLIDSLLSALPFAHPSCLQSEPSHTRVLGKRPCISIEVWISGLRHLPGLGFMARAEELSASVTNPHILVWCSSLQQWELMWDQWCAFGVSPEPHPTAIC